MANSSCQQGEIFQRRRSLKATIWIGEKAALAPAMVAPDAMVDQTEARLLPLLAPVSQAPSQQKARMRRLMALCFLLARSTSKRGYRSEGKADPLSGLKKSLRSYP